ncbi:MAG: hypothetical protein H0W15_02435 [Gemmatimonadales bacterium]|nr:hypothetical protein [Gemmatimonadales bacterium]
MSRWVLGSIVGALAAAPLAFGGATSATIETAAQAVSVGLFVAAVVFVGLGVRWGRRWAI